MAGLGHAAVVAGSATGEGGGSPRAGEGGVSATGEGVVIGGGGGECPRAGKGGCRRRGRIWPVGWKRWLEMASSLRMVLWPRARSVAMWVCFGIDLSALHSLFAPPHPDPGLVRELLRLQSTFSALDR